MNVARARIMLKLNHIYVLYVYISAWLELVIIIYFRLNWWIVCRREIIQISNTGRFIKLHFTKIYNIFIHLVKWNRCCEYARVCNVMSASCVCVCTSVNDCVNACAFSPWVCLVYFVLQKANVFLFIETFPLPPQSLCSFFFYLSQSSLPLCDCKSISIALLNVFFQTTEDRLFMSFTITINTWSGNLCEFVAHTNAELFVIDILLLLFYYTFMRV